MGVCAKFVGCLPQAVSDVIDVGLARWLYGSHGSIMLLLRPLARVIWSGAPSESNELGQNGLPQSSCVVAGAEERHLCVAPGRVVVGITYAQFPERCYQVAAGFMSMRQPLVTQHVPGLPNELRVRRSSVLLCEIHYGGVSPQPYEVSDALYEAARQTLPLELLRRYHNDSSPMAAARRIISSPPLTDGRLS
jgi:hypothetical protein